MVAFTEEHKNRISRALRGEQAYQWKGGKRIDSNGYVEAHVYKDSPYYPMSTTGHIREHRLVMAQFLGRCLTTDEFVHHINGDKTDNRIENLQLVGRGEHYPALHLVQLQEENKRLKKEIEMLRSRK